MRKIALTPLFLLASGLLALGACGGSTSSSSGASSGTSSVPTSSEAPSSTSEPIVLVAPVVSVDGRTISWEEVENAVTYGIFVSDVQVEEIEGTEYTFAYRDSADSLMVKVAAYAGDFTSPLSNEVEVTFKACEYYSWDTKADLVTDWEIDSQNYKPGVGEGIDLGGPGCMRIPLAVTAEHYIFTFDARMFIGQEPEGEVTGAVIEVSADSTIINAYGTTSNSVELPFGTDNWFSYSYDLTNFVDSTVILKIEQVKENVNHCVITRARLNNDLTGLVANEDTEWDGKDSLVANFRVSGNYRDGTGEGFDLNSYDDGIRSSCSKIIHISSEATILKIRIRMFSGQDSNEAHLVIRVDGNIIRSAGQETDYTVLPGDTDAPFDYYFDLSFYAGMTVRLDISQESEVGHTVMQYIGFCSESKIFDSESIGYYNKGAMEDKWTLCGSYRDGVGEGFDLDSSNRVNNDEVRSSISKLVTISASNVLLTANFRQFGGQEGDWNNNARLVLRVNGKTIVPLNPSNSEEDYYVEDDLSKDAGGTATAVWNLAEFAGKTVLLNICNDQKTYHCVVRSVSFAGLDVQESLSWNAEQIQTKWATAGVANVRNEGYDLEAWDGQGGVYVATAVSSEKTKLVVTARMYVGQDDTNADVALFVNGADIAESTGITQLDCTTDNEQVLTYDLSEYAGTNIALGFRNTSDATHHTVLISIAFSA